jgi:hypothetical protein
MTDKMIWGILISSVIVDLALIIGSIVRPDISFSFFMMLGIFGFGQFITFIAIGSAE